MLVDANEVLDMQMRCNEQSVDECNKLYANDIHTNEGHPGPLSGWLWYANE